MSKSAKDKKFYKWYEDVFLEIILTHDERYISHNKPHSPNVIALYEQMTGEKR